ncbi:MAG TPA: heavy metal-associated domain-containing protein [Flavobacterium sp.]|nr:heavy metal-associated domain-containing protein [Flavobacterium sp.]
MKNLFKFIAAAFILVLCSTTAAAQQKATQTAVIKTAIYCDHCKACETCGPQIEKKLLKEKGVQMVTLDETAMTIKVVYNSKKTDLDKIKTAISKLGYDADDVKADVAAYDALDGCCKKN